MANLVIINGAPGAGKSTLMKWLAPQLGLPMAAKDDLKEFLFDYMGHSDREWSRILGRTSNELLYTLTDEFLAADKSLMIESVFWPEYAVKPLQRIIEEHSAYAVEIYCSADDDVRLQRFLMRAETSARHPGHVDNLATFRDVTGCGPLNLGEVIQVDTTTGGDELYAYILEQIGKLLPMEDSHA